MSTKLWPIVLAVAGVTTVVVAALFFTGAFAGTGQLAVAVHDAPCAECSQVWVTFTSVAVHESDLSGNGWTTLNVSGATVDLMALNGSAFAKVIDVASLKTGHYEQVRLTVSHVAVVLVGGSNVTASLPDATSADVNGAFSVTSGATTTLSIDLDLATSLHVTGAGATLNATFTPNIGSVVVT